LKYKANSGSIEDIKIYGYADADFARDQDTKKSITGFVFFFNECAISWTSKKQATVALFTAEAEYMALSAAGNEAIWRRRLLEEMDFGYGHISTSIDLW